VKRYALLPVVLVLLAGCSQAKPAITYEHLPATEIVPPVVVVPSSPPPVTPTQRVVSAYPLEPGAPVEELLRIPIGQGSEAISPDGRYLFFTQCDPCDERRIYTPAILDRTTGKIATAKESVQGAFMSHLATWSGNGFWIEPLVHVGVDGALDRLTVLRQSILPAGVHLVTAAVSPDGAWVIAAVEPDVRHLESNFVDVVLGPPTGVNPIRFAQAFEANDSQRGSLVQIAWSPDSSQVIICALECRLIDPNHPAKVNWRPLPLFGYRDAPTWSPDGRSLLYQGVGIVGLDGQVKLSIPDLSGMWNRTGSAVISWGPLREEITLADQHKPYPKLGDDGWFLGWLPDGRAVYRSNQ
jgi:hypothetical protein